MGTDGEELQPDDDDHRTDVDVRQVVTQTGHAVDVAVVQHVQHQRQDPLQVGLELARPLGGLVVQAEVVLDRATSQEDDLDGVADQHPPQVLHEQRGDQQRHGRHDVGSFICRGVDRLAEVRDALELHALLPAQSLLPLQVVERVEREREVVLDAQRVLLEAGDRSIEQVGLPRVGGQHHCADEEEDLDPASSSQHGQGQSDEHGNRQVEASLAQLVAGLAHVVQADHPSEHETSGRRVLSGLAILGKRVRKRDRRHVRTPSGRGKSPFGTLLYHVERLTARSHVGG